MSVRSTRRPQTLVLVAFVLAALTSGLLAPGGAEARPPKRVTPRVGMHASATKLSPGEAVRLSGRVSGPSARATVVLQVVAGGRWKPRARTKVARDRSYRFRTRVTSTAAYRVKVVRNARLTAAYSKTLTVRITQHQTPPPATPGSTLTTVRARILADTNAFRASHGMAPLKVKAGLDTVAQDWTEVMASSGNFIHNPDVFSEIPQGWSRAGENIAYGYSPDAVVTAWINSPDHKANLLGDYTHIGIGYAVDSQGTPYYTQDFGKY